MKKKLLIFVFFFLSIMAIHAQKVTVTGLITDDLNDPLPGVSVVAKGTMVAVISDVDGRYSIVVPENVNTLVFTFLGMQRKEVSIPKNGGVLNVIMLSDDNILDEVVVTGYGTYKKSAYAGSASTIRTQDMQDIPATDFSTLLQGNASGVQVNSTSGQPGSSTDIMIRGLGSFNASPSPLYVIDGVPVMSGNIASSTSNDAGLDIMSTISNSDIENITVIKDAAAASLYGSRAANGVILITTKSGKEGKPSFNLKMDYGLSSAATNYREIMSGPERRAMLEEGLRNQAVYLMKLTDPATIDNHVKSKIDDYAPIPWNGWADWDKALFRRNSPYRNVEFSAAGGDSKLSYYTSLSYMNQAGLTYQSDFSRITGRLNVRYKMTKQLELGANILYSNISQDVNSEGGTYTSPIYSSKHKVTPSEPIYNEDGTFFEGFFSNGKRNPKAASLYNYKKQKVDRTFNTIYANYKFINELVFNTTFSLDHSTSRYNAWSDPRSSDGKELNGILDSRFYQYDQIVWKNSLTYTKLFADKHHFDILGGYEVSQYKRDNLEGTKQNFPDVDKTVPSNGAKITDLSGELREWRLLSYLARANYNFDNKYFLGASARIDGSSRLYSDSRWGTFWSASGAWRLSEEEFMKPLRDVLSETKVRASYGTNGTLPSETKLFAYMDLMGYKYPYNGQPGMRDSQIGNKDLRWEKNKNLNLGLDFRLFNRVGVTFEWYTRTTSDLLMDMPISMTTGFDKYLTNVGTVKNNGVEIEINADIINSKDFMWRSSLNLGHNKNKITKLGGDQTEIKTGAYIRTIGQPYYSYYVIEFAGINPETGYPQYYVNAESGDPKEITEDATKANRVIYKSAEPSLSGGWTNMFKYKMIDLSFTWTFSLGGYSYDNAASKTELAGKTGFDNIPKYYKDRWQKPGDKTDVEMFMVGNPYDMSSKTNSRRIHSTDHLRLKNLTVGVSIPKKITQKAKLNNVRAYFSAVNLLTFAAYDNYDPEVARNGSIYFDSPKLKTITFGLDIKF